MAHIYYKKPSGEVFRYEPGRMVKSSCDSKFTLCDAKGKVIKKEEKKAEK